MTLVEAQDAPGSVSLRKNCDRAIGKTQREIRIAGVKLGDRRIVTRFQAGDVIAPRGEITEEGTSSRMAKADTQQIVDLGRDRCWEDQRSLLLADFQQRLELGLLGVRQCDQRRRVENERHSPKPRSSSSSGISETGRGSVSMRSKLPATAKFLSRFGAGR